MSELPQAVSDGTRAKVARMSNEVRPRVLSMRRPYWAGTTGVFKIGSVTQLIRSQLIARLRFIIPNDFGFVDFRVVVA